jgi:hypothetical protein
MLELRLYRLKVIRPTQTPIWSGEWDTESLIRSAIEDGPEKETRRGFTWHVGNVSPIDANGIYFRFGRTTRATEALFDAKSRRFVDQERERSPYSHVFVDVRLGVCAIAKQSELSTHPDGIARQLAMLMNDTPTSYETGARFIIDRIKDPAQFIQQLYDAQSVVSFSTTFSRPNPFDVNEDFQRPMEKLLQEADGNTGRTRIKGDDLDRTVLEELTRSAAATGNDADATFYLRDQTKAVRRTLRENSAILPLPDLQSDDDRIGVIEAIREFYQRIRQPDDE